MLTSSLVCIQIGLNTLEELDYVEPKLQVFMGSQSSGVRQTSGSGEWV